MNERAKQRLRDALRAAETIPDFLGGATLDEYRASYGMQLQIERLFEIVGEALNQARIVGDEELIHSRIPQIYSIIGMRNRISHGYDKIDNEVLWDTATTNIPRLADQLRELLKSLE